MNVTRHISIDDEHIAKMKPYLEKHHGNFGAALREIIHKAGKYHQRMHLSSIDMPLLNWMLTEVDDILIPDDILDELIDPSLIHSMEKLEQYLNNKFSDLGWEVSFELNYDNGTFPSEVFAEIRGSPHKIKFFACMLSQFLVKNSIDVASLEVRSVTNLNESIKVEFSRSKRKEALDSLNTFFGGMNDVLNAIRSRPSFWDALIKRHLRSNYSMVTVHKNFFEDLLANEIPTEAITIENLVKRPIEEIPLNEMLSLIKKVYETSRIVDVVDIDKETITIVHSYRNKEAQEKLIKSMTTLLEMNGHLYDAKSIANMIVLTHRPDVGIKINEIVGNLKTSDSRIDQELIVFMAFLKGLKEIPDIPLSLASLGRRIGISLMQEYEKENNIKSWELETFKNAFGMIDSKLHRISEWKLNGKNLVYTVKKCTLASENETFDTHVCHTARETFKGAMSYAFGNKAELSVNRLLSHGDNFCEVVIRKP